MIKQQGKKMINNPKIYNMVINKKHIVFEIKEDGVLYMHYSCKCCGDGSAEIRYYDLMVEASNDAILTITNPNMSSSEWECKIESNNGLIITNPNISLSEWGRKMSVEIRELLLDIKSLPSEYKTKALEDMILFIKHYRQNSIKQMRARMKAGITHDCLNPEGYKIDIKTGKKICYVCKKRGKMKTCSGCCNISYCSKECSTADWKRHKHNCAAK